MSGNCPNSPFVRCFSAGKWLVRATQNHQDYQACPRRESSETHSPPIPVIKYVKLYHSTHVGHGYGGRLWTWRRLWTWTVMDDIQSSLKVSLHLHPAVTERW
ncbi:hypothetical protein CEXT_191371 [Caerostris extrusa]|uniref:Uncharacterized protein n=1 Tax=Caerostris extrusa TaxID=172846 RepID=A0AAV4W1Q0_CAEEX|nr:hypothetical protein CEXT_191371 [Caerostris extrusa]